MKINIRLFLVLLGALFLALGCAGESGGDDHHHVTFPTSNTITFTARNTSDENIHIYMEGGDRTEANKVPAGESRIFHTKIYTWESQEDFVQVKFEGSNDAGVLQFADIVFSGTDVKDGKLLTVTWNGTDMTVVKS